MEKEREEERREHMDKDIVGDNFRSTTAAAFFVLNMGLSTQPTPTTMVYIYLDTFFFRMQSGGRGNNWATSWS